MPFTFARHLAALVAALMLAGCAQHPYEKREYRERYAVAQKMFAERCQKSGVFIHRTADNVEGIFLMKLRPDKINFSDQYKLDDPYGRDLSGDGYIDSFLRGNMNSEGKFQDNLPPRPGYRYVEAIDPKDGQRYRYTGSVKEVTRTTSPLIGEGGKTFKTKAFTLDKVPAPGPMPRYGVTYDDISTKEERDYWIAGSSLRVIDLQTYEVMAERIGYMMDRGQGSRAGDRSPWLFAADNACPSFGARYGSAGQSHQTEEFVQKVLKPLRGE